MSDLQRVIIKMLCRRIRYWRREAFRSIGVTAGLWKAIPMPVRRKMVRNARYQSREKRGSS